MTDRLLRIQKGRHYDRPAEEESFEEVVEEKETVQTAETEDSAE